MLTIDTLSVAHGTQTILEDVSLSFRPGEITALVGPNGAGKSTLLRTIFAEHSAACGGIAFDGTTLAGTDLRRWRAPFGFMPQDSASNAGLTALEVVLLGSLDRLSLTVSDRLLERAADGLDRLNMLAVANRRIETLSGGQRQLVFFAQTMMRAPRALLLDEPVSALDVRHQMLLLRRVRHETVARGIVTVAVLHDLNLASGFADRVVVLHRGGILADGAPGQVLSPGLLADVYGVEAEVQHDAGGRPWVHVRDAAEGDAGVAEPPAPADGGASA